MPDGSSLPEIKISELPVATAANLADQIEVNQAGITRSITVAQVGQALPPIDLSAYATLASPVFTGNPQAPTAPPGDADNSIATTGFVQATVSSAISGLPAPPTTLPPTGAAGGDLAGVYPSPTIKTNVNLGGAPTTTTPATADNSTKIPTTAFVKAQGYALSSSIPTTLPPSGAAGGMLNGNYPNPGIAPAGTNGFVMTTVAGVAAWAAASGGASISVGDTPPASPTAGALWWNSVLGTMFIYYNDGNSTQWVPAAPAASGVVPGTLSLYSEVLLAANTASMQVSWPSGVRKIEIEYFAQNVGNVGDSVNFRAMVNGVVQSATGYANQWVFGSGSTPVAGLTTNQVFWQALAGMFITKGTLKPAVTSTQTFMEHTQVGTSATAGYALECFHWGGPTGNMNGVQMYNASGTLFLPGSFLRVYVVV